MWLAQPWEAKGKPRKSQGKAKGKPRKSHGLVNPKQSLGSSEPSEASTPKCPHQEASPSHLGIVTGPDSELSIGTNKTLSGLCQACTTVPQQEERPVIDKY